MMLCSTLAKAVFACKGKCGKTWTPLNFFRTLAFLNCFCSSVCLEGVQKFEKLDNDQLTTSGRHKCGSTSFPGLSIQMEKNEKMLTARKGGSFSIFGLPMATFHKWVAWVANTNSASVLYQWRDLQHSFEICRKSERAQKCSEIFAMIEISRGREWMNLEPGKIQSCIFARSYLQRS